MRGFGKLATDMVALGKNLTETLQATVTLERFVEDEKTFTNIAGRRLYAGVPTQHKVFITSRLRYVSVDGSVQGVQVSSVQFMEPLMITTRDRITLPDGSQPQIISVDGPLNPDGVYYAPKVTF